MPGAFNPNGQTANIPPPSGDPLQAEKYVNQLISLIGQDKLIVAHTDLSKFDPSSLQDHYSLELKEYHVEVSHNKHPNSGKDSYVMLFTNIKRLTDNNCEKIILAYMHMDVSQFIRFKKVSIEQVEKRIKAEEERKLKNALEGVDLILEDLTGQSLEPNKPPVDSQQAVPAFS